MECGIPSLDQVAVASVDDTNPTWCPETSDGNDQKYAIYSKDGTGNDCSSDNRFAPSPEWFMISVVIFIAGRTEADIFIVFNVFPVRYSSPDSSSTKPLETARWLAVFQSADARSKAATC